MMYGELISDRSPQKLLKGFHGNQHFIVGGITLSTNGDIKLFRVFSCMLFAGKKEKEVHIGYEGVPFFIASYTSWNTAGLKELSREGKKRDFFFARHSTIFILLRLRGKSGIAPIPFLLLGNSDCDFQFNTPD